MKKLVVFCILCLCLSGTLVFARSMAQTGTDGLTYLEGLEDVPLAPGLTEIDDSLVIFDKPEGRIVQSDAKGKARWSMIRSFYAETLPQLGWKPAPPDSVSPDKAGAGRLLAFQREDERLEISLISENVQAGSVKLRFSLTPE